jgi:predicted ATPase/DNA-binding SARP family transcriptional activator
MATPIEIRLLGGFGVSVGGNAVPERAWRLRKAKSLLKLLALAPDHRVHREAATEALWPERSIAAAANNFHQALYVARRALEAAGADAAASLALRDDMLLLSARVDLRVDVDDFESAAARARATGETSDYRAALDLYAGELLPEDRYEPWATGRREALHEAHLALLLELAAQLEDNQAVELLEHAVVVAPLHEAAHRALMNLFAATGRRQQALAQYHQLRAELERELAAAPDPQTTRLYRELLSGASEPAPREPATPASARHNLPIALTSFVGRDRELSELARLLERDRLITLTGAGGAGKTRLAMEAARARIGAYPDGVWLVELASIADPAWVAPAVAAALGLTLPPQHPGVEGLATQLREQDLLLVLDNCEHLISVAAALTEHILSRCEGVHILATSREPLRVPGEVTWRVPSLELPARGRDTSAAGIGASESVRLFCERAANTTPGFVLDEANAAAVAEICLRLDGMPLALELAAARIGALSPGQIAERLGDSLSVLSAGSRSALDRQQTLRATLGWSHDLLTEPERAQFRRLAVFAGPFTLEAAEAVTAGDGIDRREVADLLGRLVDKSLVVAEDVAAGYRYRLLEPMRQYAHERLMEAREAPAVEGRHLAFYLDLARAADPEGGPDAGAGIRLESEHDNLRAALAWALREQPEQALRLAVHTWPMWMSGSHFEEGSRWLRAALAATPAATRLRADALRAESGLEIRLGRTMRLSELGGERVAIYRELGDRHAEAHALDEAGVYEYMCGDYDRAEQLYAESLALGEELDDVKVAAAVLHSRGVLAHCRGDFGAASDTLIDSLARLRAISPDDSDPFFRVHSVGLFVAPEGPARAPRIYFEETAQFFRRVDALHAIGYVLAALGDVARAQSLRTPARERLTESLDHFRGTQDPMGTAFALNRLGNLAGALGEHELGREWLEEGLALRRDLGDRRGIGITLGNLGVLAARSGDTEGGRATVREALALFEETDDAPGQMGMRLALGNIAADEGDLESARSLLLASRDLAEAQLLFRCAGWMAVTLAELESTAGDAARAAELVDWALERLRALGDRWGVARCMELREGGAKRPLSRAREG